MMEIMDVMHPKSWVSKKSKTNPPQKSQDVVAVLAHLLLFTPAVAFPRLSACALAMTEAALRQPGEEKIYLAAAVVVSVSQRLQKYMVGNSPLLKAEEEHLAQLALQLQHVQQDLECVTHLERDLSLAAANARDQGNLSFFVYSRVLAASEHVNRAKEQYKRLFVLSTWEPQLLLAAGSSTCTIFGQNARFAAVLSGSTCSWQRSRSSKIKDFKTVGNHPHPPFHDLFRNMWAIFMDIDGYF